MRRFTADFETNNYGDRANVWAWGVCEIGAPDNFMYGNNIDDFILFCYKQKSNIQLYFHNLKFDGEFIFYYLLNISIIKFKASMVSLKVIPLAYGFFET